MEKFQIDFHFKNYKGLGVDQPLDVSFEGDVMLVEAACRGGKTSLITAIHEAFMLKSITPEPLTSGKDSGQKKVTIPGIDGTPITIVHNFEKDNPSGSFYAIDSNGKIIQNASTIKRLIGDYAPITVMDFFQGMKTAEGRRLLVKNYLVPLMGENGARIMEINKMINESGTLYKERTAANNELKAFDALPKETITEEDKALIPQKTAFTDALNKITEEIEKIKKTNEGYNLVLLSLKSDLSSLSTRYKYDESFVSSIADLFSKKIDAYDNAFLANATKLSELSSRFTKGQSAIDNIKSLEEKSIRITNYESNRKAIVDKIGSINDKMKLLSDERTKLLSLSKLPTGISTDGETIKLDGFDFVESQVSGSQAMIAIANVLCALFSGKIVVVGPITEFDTASLNELINIGKAFNKCVVLTKVVDNSSLGVRAIIHD